MYSTHPRRDIKWTDADDRMVAQVLRTAPQVEKRGLSGAASATAADTANGNTATAEDEAHAVPT